ncbi:hypothetical protein [Fredinandcohnia quinoae]|uniref:Uncharacterized protein n=1 Tax=Fredinandcohnia quinoae TaxID=2918902 RepID=A0AAW5EAZ0_9BACI|nr:hypothetical protein [Fredinandcohnia sp. SECRCQ15]MCH1626328.1 hypothetical protein [Fredinandcohnia sp. SECRCQ15]
MEMNVYMDISVILFLIVGLSTALTIFKDTRKRILKICSATCLSAFSIVIFWRAASILSYFH